MQGQSCVLSQHWWERRAPSGLMITISPGLTSRTRSKPRGPKAQSSDATAHCGEAGRCGVLNVEVPGELSARRWVAVPATDLRTPLCQPAPQDEGADAVGVAEAAQPDALDEADARVGALHDLHHALAGLKDKVGLLGVGVAVAGVDAALVRAVDLVGEDVEEDLGVGLSAQVTVEERRRRRQELPARCDGQ